VARGTVTSFGGGKKSDANRQQWTRISNRKERNLQGARGLNSTKSRICPAACQSTTGTIQPSRVNSRWLSRRCWDRLGLDGLMVDAKLFRKGAPLAQAIGHLARSGAMSLGPLYRTSAVVASTGPLQFTKVLDVGCDGRGSVGDGRNRVGSIGDAGLRFGSIGKRIYPHQRLFNSGGIVLPADEHIHTCLCECWWNPSQDGVRQQQSVGWCDAVHSVRTNRLGVSGVDDLRLTHV
jgi:hypothetical protein